MAEDPKTFKIFIALLASCGSDGIAQVSSTFLSAACYMPIEEVDNSLAILEAPDKRSRSLEDEGRRIRRVDGGYFIVNYKKYRGFDYSTKDEAVRKRRYRLGHCPGHRGTSLGQVGTSPGRSASASVLTITTILTKWNTFATLYNLNKITEIEKGSERWSRLQSRMKKEGFNFDSLLETMGKSPFLLGQVDPKPGSARFFATFDWIINKSNYQKIVEGNYLERAPVPEEDKFIKYMREKDERKKKE
jgi:hypothetical protein